MRKQTHFKKVVSFALAAAMAVSVCTAALADEATNGATNEAAASEQIETQSADETENGIDALTAEEGGQPAGLADEGTVTDAGFDQALSGKGLQSLPDRHTADLENFCQLIFRREALTRLPLSGQNLIFELIFNLRRQFDATDRVKCHAIFLPFLDSVFITIPACN